jgi:hypothetical protein
MLRSAFTLLVILLGTLPVLAQSPREERLKALDAERFSAQIKKDSLSLSRLLSDKLLYTHSNGIQESKAAYMGGILSGKSNYVSVETDGVQVRFFGPTAIITGRARMVLLIDGKQTPRTMMYTDVWHKVGKDWQLVSWAASRLAD